MVYIAKKQTHSPPFPPRALPVLFLPIEVGHDDQQAADEGVSSRGSGRAGGALARGLCSQHGTALLGVGELLLHLHILLPEQGQMLLQLGHLLCHAPGGQNKMQQVG